MTAPIPGPGLILGDRYRLVRQIAIGGMGEVWVAQDASLSRDVAIKVLKAEYAGNADFLARLRTEARNAASLSDSGIAQLYDYGEQGGIGYLVMELVVGEPMSDLLERSPVLPLDRTLNILAQAARALHSAHVAGVVHRDVKPGNILLERNGEVKITDFGVSLAADQAPMTATGMVMGTAQYLSPEQAVGRPATPSSDIYALGVIAFEALVGHRPFTGKTAVDIAVAHVNEPIPALPSSVPPDLSALVTRMLAKDPSDRPRSGAQLAVMLDEIGTRYRTNPWLGSVGASSGPQRTVSQVKASTPVQPTPAQPASGRPASGLSASAQGAAVRQGAAQPTAAGPAAARPSAAQPTAAGPASAHAVPGYSAPGTGASAPGPGTGPSGPGAARPAVRSSRTPPGARPNPARADSARTDSARPNPARTDSARTDPARPNPARAHHARTARRGTATGRRSTTAHASTQAAAPAAPRRSSTTTGQRVGRWSWQAVVLAILVIAVLIAWLVGAFSSDADAATMAAIGGGTVKIRVHTAIDAVDREQCIPAVRSGPPQLTPAGGSRHAVPTSRKDI